MTSIDININGKQVSAEVEDRTTLADFIREQAELTGTHLACEHGVCGACTILLDDEPIRSCITLAAAADGKDVRTVEGLVGDEIGDILRQSFHEAHGLQCGFCTPGMLITCRDILQRIPDLDDEKIRHELSGNICRCTGYMGIVASVKLAAERLKQNGRS